MESDRSHYVTFVCRICSGLADMNAMVTGRCSHAFCKSCVNDWLTKSTACPACNLPLEGTSNEERGSSIGTATFPNGINIANLKTSQPLAFACMSRIRVCCPRCKTWKGEYGKLQEHVKVHHPARDSAPLEGNRKPTNRRASEVLPSRPVAGTAAGRRQSVQIAASTPFDNRKSDRRRSVMASFKMNEREDSLSSADTSQGKGSRIEGDVHRLGITEQIPPPNENSKKLALSDAGILKEKGNAKFNKGEYAEAKDFYNRALAIVKGIKVVVSNEDRIAVASLYSNRGATFAKEKLTDEAIRDYDSAIRIVPDFPKAYARKFKLLTSKGRLTEAKLLMEAAVSKIPGDKAFLDELKTTNRILEGMETIKKMLQRHQYVEACHAATALLKTTDNVAAILLSAEADASLGLIESATEKCEFVLNSDPTDAAGLRTKGYALFLAGNIEAAMGLLKETTNLDPTNIRSEKLFMLFRKVQNDVTKARAALSKADGSRMMLKMAVECFSSAIAEESIPPRSPIMSALRTERAESELQLMHFPEALSDARVVLEANPRCSQAWVVQTNALIATGRAHEARAKIRAARQTWACNLPEMEEAYARADFESKLIDVDKELRSMVTSASSVRRSDGPQTDRLASSDHHDSHRASEPNLRVTRKPSYELGKTDTRFMNSDKRNYRPADIRPRRSSTAAGPSAVRDARAEQDRRRASDGSLPMSKERIGANRATGLEKTGVVRKIS